MSSVPQFEFTARDFESNLEALKQLIRVREPEKWNSFFSGDLSTTLLEAIAYNYTMLAYTQDRQALECFLDTLQLRESALHFAKLTSYQVRRGTTASVDVYASGNNTPKNGNRFRIKKGTPIQDKLGQTWEVSQDYFVEAGDLSPITPVSKYGDIKGRVPSTTNVQEVAALIKLEPGSSIAELVDESGERFASDINFTARVGAGQIVVLGNEWDGSEFGNAPNPTKDEYAIIEASKYDFDINDNTILYLDRVWDGTSTWVGKWTIESRNITLYQGESKTERFIGPVEAVARAGHTVQGTYFPVVMGPLDAPTPSGNRLTGGAGSGIQIFVNGVEWQETNSLLFESPDSKAFQVEFDENDKFEARFGDGIFGASLPESASIEIIYRVGGGSTGNITQNTIDTAILIGDAQGSPNNNTQIYLSNTYTVGTGGQDRESLDEIKQNIPIHMRTNDRGVSVEDYAYLASNFSDPIAGRVKIAKGTIHKNLAPREQNIIWVYTWVEGVNGQLAAPSLALKRALLEYMNERKMVTDEVVIRDGESSKIPIEVRYCFEQGSDRVQVQQKVQSAVNDVFAALKPSDSLRISALYQAVEAVPEIKFCQFINPTTDVIALNEFELFANTVQIPATTRLEERAFLGEKTIRVADPGLFFEQGEVTIFEAGKHPSAATVVNITNDVLTLKDNGALQDNYTLDALVANSAYYPQDWQFEQPTDIFITYSIGNQTSSLVTQAVKRKIKRYFTETLRPEEPLTRTKLRALVQSINNISQSDVRLHSVDGVSEQVVPSASEKITLGVLSINNEVL